MHLQVTMRGLGSTNPVTGCPLTAALTAFGGKWKLIIVYWLGGRAMHFAELRRHIDGISPKVLSQQLRELARDGIVERTRSGKIPAPVVYSLTEYGRSLLPLLEAVRQWGNGHLVRSARLKANGKNAAQLPANEDRQPDIPPERGSQGRTFSTTRHS